MEYQEKIKKLIDDAKENKLFTGGVSEERVKRIEEKLGVILPESYKWFLREYGDGGIFHIDILGAALNDNDVCVEYTEKCKELGLPKGYVIIESCDEWDYCLDTNALVDGECKVVDWSVGYGEDTTKHIETFNNFYEFLINKFSNAF